MIKVKLLILRDWSMIYLIKSAHVMLLCHVLPTLDISSDLLFINFEGI